MNTGNLRLLNLAKKWLRISVLVLILLQLSALSALASKKVLVRWGTDGGWLGDGGSVSVTGYTVTNGNKVTFDDPATLVFTITPATGYSIASVEWKDGDPNGFTPGGGTLLTPNGSNQVSITTGSNCSFQVTFAANAQRGILTYYGTGAIDDTAATQPNWVGGAVYHEILGWWDNPVGGPSYTVDTYLLPGTQVIRIVPGTSPNYTIAAVKYCEATWSDPQHVKVIGTPTSVSPDSGGRFSFTAVSPKSYIVFVQFALVGAQGGDIGAWYGTNNSTGYDTPTANGSGGSVWKTSPGSTVQLANRDPSGATVTSNGNVTVEVRPAPGFKITSINYGDTTPSSSVTVPAGQTSSMYITFPVTGGHSYVVWAVFTSTAASSFTVTGAVDPATPAECASTITPSSQTVNINQAGTFTFSTPLNCMVESVNFNGQGAQAWVGTGFVYTTPPITANSSFLVKFKPIGYNLVAEVDPSSPTGCGTISPSGTVFAPKGSSARFTFDMVPTCTVSHVWVTDSDKGYSETDIAPLFPPEYTFNNVQADGHIKIKFSAVVPASADAYCQVPPYVTGQSGLSPNVLVVFDNSGSMGGNDSDGYAYYTRKTYGCTASGASSTLGSGACTAFYGYFDPGKMYKTVAGNANKYVIDPVNLDLSSTNGKSGNYLNFRNMHKVDVVRKALTGGKVANRNIDPATSSYFLVTDNGKQVEYGNTLPTGLIQQYAGKIRFGLMVFNNPAEGGRLAAIPGTSRVAELGSSQSDLIAAVESPETDPLTNTPIAETLYEAIRYFQAKPSAYNSGVDYGRMDPIQSSCQKHFILLVTDGEPNSNQNLPGLSTHPTMNGYNDTVFNVNTWENRIPASDRADNNGSSCFSSSYKCPPGTSNSCSTNSEKVEAVSFYMHNSDLRSSAFGNDLPGTQNVTLFDIYAFGDGTGTKTLQMAAKYGGYTNTNGNAPSPNSWPSPDVQSEWNSKGDCVPNNYFEAGSGDALQASLNTAITQILAKVASGTAASILGSSSGSGANMLQAVFFPDKIFQNSTEATWVGELQNLWYYVDPFIRNSSVREDTAYSGGDTHVLNLKDDYLANFFFDSDQQNTRARLFQDSNGDGVGENLVKTVDSDQVQSIWLAGRTLWARSAATRVIHTSIDGVSLLGNNHGSDAYGGFNSSATRAAQLQPYLQAADNDGNAEAMKVIDYIRGTDQTNYRVRKVSLFPSDTPADYKEWKLGDIIASTPRIQSASRLHAYGVASPSGYGDASYNSFINSDNYKGRGMVYVGANDGMLHAFKLGTLSTSGSAVAGDVRATLTGSNLGEEQWAYIPRNALPYLKYLTEKESYKHLYYVDGPIVLADVATGSCHGGDYSGCPKDTTNGSNWRTVLIAGMGLGGASKVRGDARCLDGADGTCVKTPIWDPTDPTRSSGVGYSSYFALDVTDQYFDKQGKLADQPTLKWEFSHPELGYSTSGAAIVRIKARDGAGIPDDGKNGKWFAIIPSGPTGPIDSVTHRFVGRSDQNLKLFVIDLGASAPLVLNSSYWIIDTGIPYAFAGNALPGAIDTDRWNAFSDGNYQDDAVYVGYTSANTTTLTPSTTWTQGGVVRLLTKEDPNPAHWVASKVIDGIGPVSTGITKLQDRNNKKLWLYFGTGRYFYTDDDSTSRRSIMAVQDGCYTTGNALDKNCDLSAAAGSVPSGSGKGRALTLSDLAENTLACSDMSGKKGWYVTLRPDDPPTLMGAERSITDPVPMGSGTVLFTTFMPTTDVCKFGGSSFMYAMRYDTGCVPTCASLGDSMITIQMSTGSLQQVNLKDAFSCTLPDGTVRQPLNPPPPPTQTPPPAPPGPNRPSMLLVGKPPNSAAPIASSSNAPLKKIMHIQER